MWYRDHLFMEPAPCSSLNSGLRDAGEQLLLAELAACPAVHLVASCDHVNTALMWTKETATRFK